MKPKRHSNGLLVTSIVLSALVAISILLQFGDFYYALKSGSRTPDFITDQLEAQQSVYGSTTDGAMIAGLRAQTSDVAAHLEISPLVPVTLVPLFLYVFVCLYDRRATIGNLGKVTASLIVLELMVMVGVYVFVTTQHIQ